MPTCRYQRVFPSQTMHMMACPTLSFSLASRTQVQTSPPTRGVALFPTQRQMMSLWHAFCSGYCCTISMACALFVLLIPQSSCADHTASVSLCVLHQMECADNMDCMYCAVPIRNAKDIAGMRAACKLARQILDQAHAAVKPGVTTDEIDQVVKKMSPASQNIIHTTCWFCLLYSSIC